MNNCREIGCHWDETYWGSSGPDLSRWKGECGRGVQYKTTGAPVASGTPGVRRTLTGGRKHRGSASEDLERRKP